MRSVSLLTTLTLLLACARAAPPVPPPPPPPVAPPPPAPAPRATTAPRAPVPFEEYFKIRRVGRRVSFSHDERWAAFSDDRAGRIDVWIAPVTGGEARQLTRVSGFVEGFAFSPTEDRFAFVADKGGDELTHVFLTDSTGKEPVDLAAGDPAGTRTDLVQWSPDGKQLLYLSSRRDPRYLDLYELDLKSGRSSLLWQASGKLSFEQASRDGRRFSITETLSDADNNLYLVERGKKGPPVLLTPHQGEVFHTSASFSPDGMYFYYLSDAGREFTALYRLELKSKQSTPVLQDEWDVEAGYFSEGGKYFISEVNADGTPRVSISTVQGPRPLVLPGGSESTVLLPVGSSRSDRYLAARVVSDREPNTLVVVDLEQQQVVRLAEPLPDSLRAQQMVAGRSVRVDSFDGQRVQAFVYAPAGEGPFPAVLEIHGGPTAQSRREFNAFRQYLVSKGYVVMVPNVRGSTGYGKSFTRLDNLDLGGGPLRDVVACKQWLVQNARVEREKVAIMGGSYGGYMTLAAATFSPREFAAHVDLFGVSDLKGLVESFPPYWAAYATFIHQKFGDPKNPAHAQYQRERSPLYFIDRIERPLLVVQGENDARVKKDQSDRVVAALQGRGVPVHYLVLPGEGHGFSQNESRIAALRAADLFLDRYLFGDTSVEVLPPH